MYAIDALRLKRDNAKERIERLCEENNIDLAAELEVYRQRYNEYCVAIKILEGSAQKVWHKWYDSVGGIGDAQKQAFADALSGESKKSPL